MNASTGLRAIAKTDTSEAIDFGPLPELIGYRIKRAHAYSVQTFTDSFDDLGLAYGQYSVLLLIALNPGLSQLSLAEAAGLDGSTIVPIMTRFAKKGWIRRSRRKEDRRIYALRVTEEGRAVLEKSRARLKAQEADLCARLTKSERTTLLHLLSKLTDRADIPSASPFSRQPPTGMSDGRRSRRAPIDEG